MSASETSVADVGASFSQREGRWAALLNRYATPFTTGLFAVSAISGVALFFHWQSGVFHGMHEWLSMLLLLPFALHLWKNWKPLLGYVRRRTLVLPLAASLVVAAPFAVAGLTGRGGGNPAFQALPLMTGASLSDLAPVLQTTPDAMVAALREKGHAVASADATLDTVAAAAGVPANELLIAMFPPR